MAFLHLLKAIGSHVTPDNIEHFIELVEKLIVLAETMEKNSTTSQNGSASGS